MSSPEKAATQMSSPYWDCCKDEETHVVMEVPRGSSTAACPRKGCDPQLKGGSPAQSPLICLDVPSSRKEDPCLSPFFAAHPKSPPKTTQGSSDRLICLIWTPLLNRKVWGKRSSIILGLISAALGEPGGHRVLQES